MSKFAIVGDSGELEDGRYDVAEAAFEAAAEMVEGEPNTTVTVVQVVREYKSEMKVTHVDL